MTVELTEHQYIQLRLERCVRRAEVDGLLTSSFVAIVHKCMSSLTGAESSVLFFLLAVTLASGRVAREVSVKEISGGLKGKDEAPSGGTGLSENSIRTAIKSLVVSGFISVFKEQKSSGTDNSARIYEINFKAVDAVLATKLAAIYPRNRSTPPAENEVPPFKNCRAVHISNYVTHEEERATSSSIRGGFTPATQQENSMAFFVGKKPKVAKERAVYSSAAQAISTVQNKTRAVVSRRAAEATEKAPAEISKDQLQALFDSAREGAGLGYRIMVTAREFGFLRKRMKENPPADLKDFLRYTLTYWGMLAQQNRKSAAANPTKAQALRALPEAPHFHTFTYWYPYFFKAYQNHLAAKVEEKRASLQPKPITAERAAPGPRRPPLRSALVSFPLRPRIIPAKITEEDLMRPTSFPEWDAVKK